MCWPLAGTAALLQPRCESGDRPPWKPVLVSGIRKGWATLSRNPACGTGTNAIHPAQQGFDVSAVTRRGSRIGPLRMTGTVRQVPDDFDHPENSFATQDIAGQGRADAFKIWRDLNAQAMATAGNVVGGKYAGNPQSGSQAASAVYGTGKGKGDKKDKAKDEGGGGGSGDDGSGSSGSGGNGDSGGGG
jgi:uncharacterized membrane protein YgcG